MLWVFGLWTPGKIAIPDLVRLGRNLWPVVHPFLTSNTAALQYPETSLPRLRRPAMIEMQTSSWNCVLVCLTWRKAHDKQEGGDQHIFLISICWTKGPAYYCSIVSLILSSIQLHSNTPHKSWNQERRGCVTAQGKDHQYLASPAFLDKESDFILPTLQHYANLTRKQHVVFLHWPFCTTVQYWPHKMHPAIWHTCPMRKTVTQSNTPKTLGTQLRESWGNAHLQIHSPPIF